jgi:hypothetical protein
MTRLRGPIATPLPSIVFGFPVVPFGVALGIAIGSYGLQSVKEISETRHATGSVVRLDHSEGMDKPAVLFTTATGKDVTFTNAVGSGSPAYQPGDAVNAAYPLGLTPP